MSDKLPMTREQIEGEMGKCSIGAFSLPEHQFKAWVRFAEHILRIGTTELREENKRLRIALVSKGCDEIFCEEAKRSCDRCDVSLHKKYAERFLKNGVPF